MSRRSVQMPVHRLRYSTPRLARWLLQVQARRMMRAGVLHHQAAVAWGRAAANGGGARAAIQMLYEWAEGFACSASVGAPPRMPRRAGGLP